MTRMNSTRESAKAATGAEGSALVMVDLGCGRRKRAGAIGVDRMVLPGVDCVCDLRSPVWPFREGSVDRFFAWHIIEHMPDLIGFMENAHRALRTGGALELEVPHGATLRYLGDPTHRTPVTCATFRYFEPEYPYNFYTTARFVTERIDLVMPPSALGWWWRVLWRRRMWTAERLLVAMCRDFGMHALLRKA